MTGVYVYLNSDKVNTLAPYWGYICYWREYEVKDGKCICKVTGETINILHAIDTHIYPDKPVEESTNKLIEGKERCYKW
jgi:hypothetical protein